MDSLTLQQPNRSGGERQTRLRSTFQPNAQPSSLSWCWQRKGDRFVVLLSGPDGQQIAINRSEPLDRAKASYSAFAGKKAAPKPGVYEVKVTVERGGSVLFERSGTYSIE